MPVRFVDTSVLLYAVSTSADEAEKAQKARALLASSDLGLSVQVLSEFYVQATRADAMTHEQAARLVDSFTRFRVQDSTLAVARAALLLRAQSSLSYWDALIIEAARALGCVELLTEDLQHGQDFYGVRVVNPFR